MRKKTILLIIVITVVLAAPIAFFYFTTKMIAPKPLTIVASETETTDIDSKHLIFLWLLPDQIYTYENDDYKFGKKFNYSDLKNFLINIIEAQKLIFL